MKKLKKLINMTFHGKEYDDMKGWGRVLMFMTIPLFLLMWIVPRIIPTKADEVEWVIIIAIIVAALVGLSFLIANIISAI